MKALLLVALFLIFVLPTPVHATTVDEFERYTPQEKGLDEKTAHHLRFHRQQIAILNAISTEMYRVRHDLNQVNWATCINYYFMITNRDEVTDEFLKLNRDLDWDDHKDTPYLIDGIILNDLTDTCQNSNLTATGKQFVNINVKDFFNRPDYDVLLNLAVTIGTQVMRAGRENNNSGYTSCLFDEFSVDLTNNKMGIGSRLALEKLKLYRDDSDKLVSTVVLDSLKQVWGDDTNLR